MHAKPKSEDDKENARWHKASIALRKEKEAEAKRAKALKPKKIGASLVVEDISGKAKKIINDVADKVFQRRALKAWKALPLAKRKAIRRGYAKRGESFTPSAWYVKRKVVGDAKERVAKSRAGATTVSRKKIPAPPANPFAALLSPVVIVPDNIAEAIIIADAGSIIRLMDQSTLYREWVSPVTRRADELLVQYGNAKKLKLGWITNKLDPKIMKPVKGPTFLVMTKQENELTAWDRLRLLVARARKTNGAISLGPWLATYGEQKEHQPLLREVTRQFGGTPVKNEPYVDRFNRLCQLILHTELDMATHKRSKKAKKTAKVAKEGRGERTMKVVKGKKAAKPKPEKSLKDRSKAKGKKSMGDFSPRSKDFDNHVIRRLIKENPRRAGTTKFKLWAKIKKGMTVKEFISKYAKMHATRAEVGRYIQWGWIKLLPPSGGDAE